MEVISTRIKLSADIVQLIRNYFLSRLARARTITPIVGQIVGHYLYNIF